ncbi:MAG: ornithine carbamoyltransferase [Armatimonadota bacterium]|nr:ornithine carbamoyltransferase [Armatimonadota bacterium]MDR5676107.1 ornithine carbamoyltransferase [Armatimonadota bacterium]MDR7386144.1 ornithine carbamoyltransferase [Armatimonadota bacterium]MDR7389027.1 ornithine carbamoyltransferase [Armatimonadota bacterium]MDR7390653.1 ornithine carbamoyltransferase [Armatimonadota bacterium]
MGRTLRGRHLLSVRDLSPQEVRQVLDLAHHLKREHRAGIRHEVLTGKAVALLFEKPSLRTRVTFEVGVRQLGGYSVYLAPQDVQLGVRETVPDVARNLSRWVDGIVARVNRHAALVELAEAAAVPVINALSDFEHPCQALGDLLTLEERFGGFSGIRAAWVGDGNNVCHSFLLAASRVGLSVAVATPPGYAPDPDVVAEAQAEARRWGASVQVLTDPHEAVAGAHVVYTDVWASMGQEAQREERRRAFQGFQVNRQLLDRADPQAVVLHCLPAHRGEEITDEVLDGPQSAVLDQAENRLHAQKAVLALVL